MHADLLDTVLLGVVFGGTCKLHVRYMSTPRIEPYTYISSNIRVWCQEMAGCRVGWVGLLVWTSQDCLLKPVIILLPSKAMVLSSFFAEVLLWLN